MSYQVIKLANGEDIVCNLVKRFGSKIEVTSPLRMDTITKETAKGTMESLALSRWVQPYSDEKVFNIESNSVVIMTPASVGLSRYYEYVLKKRGESILQSENEFKNQKLNIRNVFINNLFKNMSTTQNALLNINYETFRKN